MTTSSSTLSYIILKYGNISNALHRLSEIINLNKTKSTQDEYNKEIAEEYKILEDFFLLKLL